MNILIGIIVKWKEENTKDVVAVVRLNWLIINILVKIKLAKMVSIPFVKNAVIVKPKVFNAG
jgi:hypothetical protein